MDLSDLDAAAVLSHADALVLRRRGLEVEDLHLLLQWAALHGSDPQADARARGVPIPPGSDRLVRVGGSGTPRVQELCVAELAVSRRVHPAACRGQLADALDLVHRLPRVWRRVQALEAERWVACQVARKTRELTLTQVALVDAAVAEAIGSLAAGRVLALVEAKVIEAAQAEHAARREGELRRRYVALGRDTSFGLRHVIARVTTADAVWIDGMVERVAGILAPRFPEGTTRQALRSEAFGWLARPAELLILLAQHGEAEDLQESRTTAVTEELVERLGTLDPGRFRSRAVVYVHLHEAAVAGTSHGPGVARVEGIGPVLLDQLSGLLGPARITLVPVVDLADRVSADAYEVPESIKDRVHLACPGDYFPYAARSGRQGLDLDHVTPYQSGGPPGQTGTHNLGPLRRGHHRVKTHALGWSVRQLGPGEYVWRTPHHRFRLTDHRGTHWLPDEIGSGFFTDDPLDRALSEIELDVHRGLLPAPDSGPARALR